MILYFLLGLFSSTTIILLGLFIYFYREKVFNVQKEKKEEISSDNIDLNDWYR